MSYTARLFTIITYVALLSSIVLATPEVVRAESGSTGSAATCQRAGCNGELCVDPARAEGIGSICMPKPEFACYQQALCERQNNGECGFTQTATLKTCLDQYLYKPEDLNKDGKVNLLDYDILASQLFKNYSVLSADLNHDGKVNLLDYAILVAAFQL